MADTPQIIYTHADASTFNIFPTSTSITWVFPGKAVKVRIKADGTAAAMNDGFTHDPNKGYRIIECTALLTGDNVSTLNGYLLPSAVPTYDATDPKIVLKLDGDTSFTILCVITHMKATFKSDSSWVVSLKFVERTT